MAKPAKKSKGGNKKQKSDVAVVNPSTDLAEATKTEENIPEDGIAVPPPTPTSQYDLLDITFQPLPPKLPDVTTLQIPLVRRNGIKLCIDTLAEYFQCNDYKFNLFQFWFLDVVTDCLWKVQDEFRFPDQLQKTVLAWILFVFDKMRDPQEDITRKKLFTIFKESILMGAEYVDEGGTELPPPEKFFALMSQEPSKRSSTVTSSVSLHSTEEDAESVIVFNTKDESARYVLPQEVCKCSEYDVSSINSVTESELTPSECEALEEVNEISSGDTSDASGNNSVVAESDENCLVEELKGKYDVISAPGSLTPSWTTLCPSDIFASSLEPEESKSEEKADSVKTVDDEADMEFDKCSYNTKMKILTKYLTSVNMYEQKVAAMDDSEKGWVPSQEEIGEVPQEDNFNESEWVDIMEADSNAVENSAFVNFGVLWAIIDFVFNYFYESFQFTLIKLAFREFPNIICQRVNQEWKAPKVPKGEFIPPPQKKEKKDKGKKKGKKDKKGKGKKDKKSKSDKSSKKDKKSKKGKGSKKDKKSSKDKSSKKSKKEKKAKPKKLTKEEKAEMERLRLEQERIEEERRKIEENKRLMFPLNDATNDDLFNQIFEGWVKVDWPPAGKGKKDKKKGKNKKDKKGGKKKK